MLDGDNVDYTVTYTKNGATITDISKVYAGVYTLKVSITSANYVLPENSEITVTVTARSMTVRIGDMQSTYSASDASTVSGFTASAVEGSVAEGDDINALFTLALAASGKLTVGQYAIYATMHTGDLASSYNVTFTGSWNMGEYRGTAGTYVVNPVSIQVISGITASDKVFDGTTKAELDLSNAQITGIITGDDVTISAVGTFTQSSVGEEIDVTITYNDLTGNDASNYTLDKTGSQFATTATITPAPMPPIDIDPDKPLEFDPDKTLDEIINGYNPDTMDMDIYYPETGDRIHITTDENGNKVATITNDNKPGNSTTIVKTPDNELVYTETSVTEGDTTTTTRTDSNGDVTTIVTKTDEDGKTTTTITYPDGSFETIITDKDGNKTVTVTNADGSIKTTVTDKATGTNYHHDGNGRQGQFNKDRNRNQTRRQLRNDHYGNDYRPRNGQCDRKGNLSRRFYGNHG